jgi:hypothetical protein
VAKLELPTLVTRDGFTTLSWGVRWLSIILLCSGICLILFVMREPSDLYLWLSWALTAMVFYTVLSAVGGARFSVGWYIGRLSWLVSALAAFHIFCNAVCSGNTEQRAWVRNSRQSAFAEEH